MICFLAGALCSGLTGFIGMSLAVRGNVRTAAAAREGKMAPALKVAFRTGAITGLLCVGLGLLGATVIVLIFQNTATSVLIGFGFGASLLALFMRVGGGIFTKAADVGADLVGKVEAGIPEDDPRNAATIADNVGDNVGDCAGMAADLFESYVITIIAVDHPRGRPPSTPSAGAAIAAKTVIFPIAIPAIGILATIIGVFVVRAGNNDKNAMAPINRGVWTAAILTIGGHGRGGRRLPPLLEGVLRRAHRCDPHAGRQPDHRALHLHRAQPGQRGGRVGPHRSGHPHPGRHRPRPRVVGVGDHRHRRWPSSVSIGLGGGNIELSLYLVSLTGIGLLSTAGMIVSEDSFGPVSDNAAGVAEMSGEFTGEAERVMVSLDAVGNTTKAVTKGVAIGSAVIASVALFASFIETIGSQLKLHPTVLAATSTGCSTCPRPRSTSPTRRSSSAC